MDGAIIGIAITAVSVGGGLIFTGYKIGKGKQPNGSSENKFVDIKDCNKYKEKNSGEHKEIFIELKKISSNTAVLLERTKDM